MIATLKNQTGQPIRVGQVTLIPISQVLHIQLAKLPVGFIWNRPMAIKVETADEAEQILPVQDVTRLALIAIAGFTLLGALLIAAARRKSLQ